MFLKIKNKNIFFNNCEINNDLDSNLKDFTKKNIPNKDLKAKKLNTQTFKIF